MSGTADIDERFEFDAPRYYCDLNTIDAGGEYNVDEWFGESALPPARANAYRRLGNRTTLT